MTEIKEDLTVDVSRLMYALTLKYKGREKELATALTRSLGAFIAIATKDTAPALRSAAKLLLATPWGRIRADHFGYSRLGIEPPKDPGSGL